MIAGTQIKLLNGSTKNVEDIKRGDLLQGYQNDPSGVVVRGIISGTCSEFYIINERVSVVTNQQMMCKEKRKGSSVVDGLFPARELKLNDKLIRGDGSTEEITSIDVVSTETSTSELVTTGNSLIIADDIVVLSRH